MARKRPPFPRQSHLRATHRMCIASGPLVRQSRWRSARAARPSSFPKSSCDTTRAADSCIPRARPLLVLPLSFLHLDPPWCQRAPASNASNTNGAASVPVAVVSFNGLGFEEKIFGAIRRLILVPRRDGVFPWRITLPLWPMRGKSTADGIGI